MKTARIYFMLMIAGMLVPWYFLLCFFFSDDFSVAHFFQRMFANPVATSIAADLLISALIAFYFMHIEGKRVGMRRTWKYMLATLLVGLSFGLPWFLYDRARIIQA